MSWFLLFIYNKYSIILELPIEFADNMEFEPVAGPSSDVQSRHDLPVVDEEKTRNLEQDIKLKMHLMTIKIKINFFSSFFLRINLTNNLVK